MKEYAPRSQALAWERIQGRSASRDAERRNRHSQARAWERGESQKVGWARCFGCPPSKAKEGGQKKTCPPYRLKRYSSFNSGFALILAPSTHFLALSFQATKRHD